MGSTNLDWRSFLDNDEINAVILGREFAPANAGHVRQRTSRRREAIDLERWERRPLSFRFKEWMARVWGRLL